MLPIHVLPHPSTLLCRTERGAPALPARRLLATLLTAALVAFGVGCSDDGGGDSSSSLTGSYAAPASPGGAAPLGGSSGCTLDVASFAVIQEADQAVILYGSGASGGILPARLVDDTLDVELVVVDEGLGTTTSIVGSLDVSRDPTRLTGALDVQISGPPLLECGPTINPVDGVRSSTSLPDADPVVAGASGDWELAVREISSVTTCDPMPDRVELLEVEIDLDAAAARLAFGETGADVLDALIVGRFLVAEDEVDMGGGEIERRLLSLEYAPPVVIDDLLLGFEVVEAGSGESACVAADEILGTRPEL